MLTLWRHGEVDSATAKYAAGKEVPWCNLEKMIISQNISVILAMQFRANKNTVMVSSFMILAAIPLFCN